MGLDMYLKKRTYIGNKYKDSDKQIKVIIPKNQKGVTFPVNNIKNERIQEIIEEVGYWRKANQIHQWFVDNVQDGEDDCKEYYVSKDQLKELLHLCKTIMNIVRYEEGDILMSTSWSGDKKTNHYGKGKIIANIEEIQDILPTSSGFFFGSTEYNEYYIRDIEDTIEILEPLLEEKGDDDFYYQSSW